jgi:hypothetical protein
MAQIVTTTTLPLTKEQFRRVVNEALHENGEKTKPPKEIEEGYSFYKRLWEEDGCSGEIRMVKSEGKMQVSFG